VAAERQRLKEALGIKGGNPFMQKMTVQCHFDIRHLMAILTEICDGRAKLS